ncbi:integrase [Bifidobacterium aemilianum]|uniref:Integrase n=2 Tax=Bifidobacterium aemilianum TaxID=2493120 RepID=A0A366KB10_9BIFI|nr:integrase [Bifidobacterium aemilianum]
MQFESHRQPPAEWVEWLDGWVASLRVHGATPATIEHWWYVVSQFAREASMPPDLVETNDVLAWLGRGVGVNTMRSEVIALNSFFQWSLRDGRRTDDPMECVPKVKRRKQKQKPAPREAVEKGMNHPDPRVRLLVMLFADAGLRRAEAVQCRTDDVIDDLTGKSLIVHGKGAKDRVVPLDEPLARELMSAGPGWVFPGQRGHICNDTAYALVKDATGWPPHAFRRRFATDVWRATGDAVKVQSLLGHESLATTQAYIYQTADDLRQAVKSMRSYRQHEGIGIAHPEQLLAAYGIPDSIVSAVVESVKTQDRSNPKLF